MTKNSAKIKDLKCKYYVGNNAYSVLGAVFSSLVSQYLLSKWLNSVA